jgi:transcriptional regulator with XRE-family HTH domain
VTQQEIADKAGVSQPMVYYYKSGKAAPSAKTLPRLAEALGVTESDLLQDDA